jgi:ABC-type transport system involved in cytochrome c biogenesis ATPase subunit/GNAT superfamily N-acetyltransferase
MSEVEFNIKPNIASVGEDEKSSGTNCLVVSSVSIKDKKKNLIIRSDGAAAVVCVHRYAVVGPKDRIVLGDGIERKVSVVDERDELIQIFPEFLVESHCMLGGKRIETKVSELVSDQDFIDYAALEAFHYRGLDLSGTNSEVGASRKSTGGRKAVLIMHIKSNNRWISAGYVELQMPLMMAKPRHIAFNRPFSHPRYDVSWDNWIKGGQSLVNRIARIARVVVNPELRGANLSSELVSAAVKFTRDRWHIGGKRALFLEISAEMLRHIDFVSSSGFHYLGDTEGNRLRLAKDLASIQKGAKGTSGIMSLQRKYHAFFETYRGQTGDSFESLRARLDSLLSHREPWKHMGLDEWLALRPVIRSPIPYYMVGLDLYSDSYVKCATVFSEPKALSSGTQRLNQISIDGLEIQSKYELSLNEHSRLIMDSFGITAKSIRARLAGPLSFTAMSGTVTFISGSSGCGKSLLLSVLDPSWKSDTVTVKGAILPSDYKVGWLQRPPSNAKLFEFLADKYGAEQAFDALARVGLTEALLFLKPFEMLSRGQRYRAMLAELLLGDADVWMLDEFCSDLDPFTASIVAAKLRKTVQAEGRIAFVAAANNSHFISALRPHRVLSLNTGGGYSIMSWKEYTDVAHE